jgi:hypothetical protein
MKQRRLPQRYAREFLRRTRKHWFAKSFGWSEFQLLMEQKEPMMLRAFTSLSLSKSGTLQKNQVLASLRNAGLPATDSNAAAMMKFLNVDTDGSIAYGQFRNFMLLLPPERLGDDPRYIFIDSFCYNLIEDMFVYVLPYSYSEGFCTSSIPYGIEA